MPQPSVSGDWRTRINSRRAAWYHAEKKEERKKKKRKQKKKNGTEPEGWTRICAFRWTKEALAAWSLHPQSLVGQGWAAGLFMQAHAGSSPARGHKPHPTPRTTMTTTIVIAGQSALVGVKVDLSTPPEAGPDSRDMRGVGVCGIKISRDHLQQPPNSGIGLASSSFFQHVERPPS
ncbi:hypothetical protein MAPG_02431 [Magnaporthiopsis poae ATCC 64411]|uniref:Uncharacterized protein n=1 Tax=Magnaporthiopsis poae (strain ATCC 64411 / 73-15) TaxID=644358 RepID=A0A0C4DRC3_MAGP6|nr:hypothetical protein MAPG_02431 [Magnaporthiopsis poae ATCC 64411]